MALDQPNPNEPDEHAHDRGRERGRPPEALHHAPRLGERARVGHRGSRPDDGEIGAHTSSTMRAGSSRSSFTRTRNVTACSPSTRR